MDNKSLGTTLTILIIVGLFALISMIMAIRNIENPPIENLKYKLPTDAVNIIDVGNHWYKFDLEGESFLWCDRRGAVVKLNNFE